MTLLTHLASGVLLSKALSLDLTNSVFICIGSICPDIIEMFVAGKNWKKFFEIHRKIFHWWILYICLFIINFIQYKYFYITYSIINYILYGCFLHLSLDLLTPSGIPFFSPNGPKIKIPLCKTGSYREFVVFSIFFILFFVL